MLSNHHRDSGVDWSGEGKSMIAGSSGPNGCQIPIEKLSGLLALVGTVLNHDQMQSMCLPWQSMKRPSRQNNLVDKKAVDKKASSKWRLTNCPCLVSVNKKVKSLMVRRKKS